MTLASQVMTRTTYWIWDGRGASLGVPGSVTGEHRRQRSAGSSAHKGLANQNCARRDGASRGLCRGAEATLCSTCPSGMRANNR